MAQQSQEYDLVCVGFGTTGLALAASLADTNADFRVQFIDRNSQFSWAPGQILPGATVASPFTRDLITSQNPRSEFTFLNFLYHTELLVQFTNASQIRPTRGLVELYFRWVAQRMEQKGWVSYGNEVVKIVPLNSRSTRQPITGWAVDTYDLHTCQYRTMVTRKIVLATGASPQIPNSLASSPASLLFKTFSSCADTVAELPQHSHPVNIAVIGEDQEAAELFEHLHTVPGKHNAVMLIRGSALRSEDSSAFSTQALDLSELSSDNTLPPEVRQRLHDSVGQSGGPTVALETTNKLYERQYEQHVGQPDPAMHRFQMWHDSEVVDATRESGNRVRFQIRNPRTGVVKTSDQLFDAVIVCAGYEFTGPEKILSSPVLRLLADREPTVDRSYRLNFRNNTLAPGCSLWMLGSLQDRTKRTDDFQTAAEKAHRAAQGILADMKNKPTKIEPVEDFAML